MRVDLCGGWLRSQVVRLASCAASIWAGVIMSSQAGNGTGSGPSHGMVQGGYPSSPAVASNANHSASFQLLPAAWCDSARSAHAWRFGIAQVATIDRQTVGSGIGSLAIWAAMRASSSSSEHCSRSETVKGFAGIDGGSDWIASRSARAQGPGSSSREGVSSVAISIGLDMGRWRPQWKRMRLTPAAWTSPQSLSGSGGRTRIALAGNFDAAESPAWSASRAMNQRGEDSILESTAGSVRADALPKVMTLASGSCWPSKRQSNSPSLTISGLPGRMTAGSG